MFTNLPTALPSLAQQQPHWHASYFLNTAAFLQLLFILETVNQVSASLITLHTKSPSLQAPGSKLSL